MSSLSADPSVPRLQCSNQTEYTAGQLLLSRQTDSTNQQTNKQKLLNLFEWSNQYEGGYAKRTTNQKTLFHERKKFTKNKI